MKRRQFIQDVAAGATLVPRLVPSPSRGMQDESDVSGNELIRLWIAENDANIAKILQQQNRQTSHRHEGGFPDQYDIYHPGRAANYVGQLVAAYVSNNSQYHVSDEIEQAINSAIGFLIRVQHEDGTIDLVTTNFHSTPDTGFVVEPLATAISCVQKLCPSRLQKFQEQNAKFLLAAGKALEIGGIHTPNHRWVVCMALARIHALFPADGYLRRINQWLAEKIDIDQDGQYTEQSSSIYSPLVNRCLITIARLLNRPTLYEPVRRNLELTRYFVRSNGEIVTDTSKRQDQFRIAKIDRYYFAYRYMAILDKNPDFAAMVRFVEESCDSSSLSQNLLQFLDDENLQQNLPGGGALLTNYEKRFSNSNLTRIKRNEVDISILGDSDRFLTFHKGSAALVVRLASAFFGKGQFVSNTVSLENGGYVLRQSLRGPYYQPFAKADIPGDGVWSKMPLHRRKQSEIQQLASTVTVLEIDGALRVQFQVDGCDGVPVAIELGFRHGGELSGVKPIPGSENSYLLMEQKGIYRAGRDVIEFGPGTIEHSWTQLRGAKPKLNAQSVYLTGYTPFHTALSIR